MSLTAEHPLRQLIQAYIFSNLAKKITVIESLVFYTNAVKMTSPSLLALAISELVCACCPQIHFPMTFVLL